MRQKTISAVSRLLWPWPKFSGAIERSSRNIMVFICSKWAWSVLLKDIFALFISDKKKVYVFARTPDRARLLSVCLFVCVQDYSKTRACIRMKCCVPTGVGTWTNWLIFEPDPDYSPDPKTRFLPPISYNFAVLHSLAYISANFTYFSAISVSICAKLARSIDRNTETEPNFRKSLSINVEFCRRKTLSCSF